MSEKIDQEIEAIKTILKALEALDDDVRNNVVEYVFKRLNLSIAPLSSAASNLARNVESSSSQSNITMGNDNEVVHIKQFKESKNPKSAIEMVAIIAYYLQHLAEPDKRQDKIQASDLKQWFNIADFPLPTEMRHILTNTKNAGYIDNVGSGEYKLNAVGHNLVKYNLPRGESKSVIKRVKRTPKKAAKKTSKR